MLETFVKTLKLSLTPVYNGKLVRHLIDSVRNHFNGLDGEFSIQSFTLYMKLNRRSSCRVEYFIKNVI